MPSRPARRALVVKLGSNALAAGRGRLDAATLRRIADDVAALRGAGWSPVLVSSGAILAGVERLGLKARPATTPLKQAAAAVGQSRLMRAWEAAFARRRLPVAQVLLTREDLRDRRRYVNARRTLLTLLELGVVPVINENDTVAVDEIKFGDNDVLSALVAELCDARLLVLLTDQEGVYTRDPRLDASARLIAEFSEAAAARVGQAGPAGSGGMASKVAAAKLAAQAGIPAVIASGSRPRALQDAASGRPVGTRFAARPSPLDKRRRWLAFACDPKGEIHVDAGAREALVRGAKSLLPAGVRAVKSRFEAGDVVRLLEGGVEFARGLTNYGAHDLARIMGKRTSQIEPALGRKGADEVVHRDNLALLA